MTKPKPKSARAKSRRGAKAAAKVKALFERTRRRIKAIEKKALAKLRRKRTK